MAHTGTIRTAAPSSPCRIYVYSTKKRKQAWYILLDSTHAGYQPFDLPLEICQVWNIYKSSLFLHSFVFVSYGQNQFPGSVSSLAKKSTLTCVSMCIVNLWLCGVSKHNGSYTVEAVFISVILQSRLLGAHHVVLTVATAWGQFWDTKLLLQHRKSGAIACGAISININAPISVWEYSLFTFLYKTSPSPSPNRKRFLSSDGGLIRCWK